MTTIRSPKLGALLTVAAVIVFGLQDGVSKHLTERYSVFFVITVRYWAFAAVLVLTHRGKAAAEEHREMFEAALARDGDCATAALETHILKGLDHTVEAMG